jgi:amino acid permease
MPQVVTSFAKALDRHEQLSPLLLDRNFWIFAFMLALIPLCFLRRLDSLRHTSYLRWVKLLKLFWEFGRPNLNSPLILSLPSTTSLIAVFYLVIIVVFYSLPSKRSHLPLPGPIYLVHIDGHHFISIFPIFVFAFTCAQNMLPVHNEIKSAKVSHFVTTRNAIFTSISMAGCIYIVSFVDCLRRGVIWIWQILFGLACGGTGLSFLWLKCRDKHHHNVPFHQSLCLLWSTFHCHSDAL